MAIDIQRNFLDAVLRASGNDPGLTKSIKLLEDPDVEEEVRVAAEANVNEACMKYGELILHGDLLTVKMIQEAKVLMSGAATAFERLEFIGPCRLQMLHMKMKKLCQDFALCMVHDINYDDVLSLPWCTALTGVKVSNEEKDIKKNDSSFEMHDQWMAAVQSSYLVNMFDNYNALYPKKLDAVENAEDVVKYVLDMLAEYQIQLYYDPLQEYVEKPGEDDLFKYCQV